MRSFLIILASYFFIHPVLGQAVGITPLDYRPVFLKNVFPDAMQPKALLNYEGSPFIFDEWLLARVILPDNRIADSVYVKLNVYDKTLHFKDDNGEEMQSRVRIKQVTIIDKNQKWQGTVFRTGYSPDPNSFFQVLADGNNIQLLKKIIVLKWETKVLGEENKKSLQLDSELYFATDEKLYPANKKCSFLAELFETKKDAILGFLSANNINCNKESDMKKIAEFINTL